MTIRVRPSVLFALLTALFIAGCQTTPPYVRTDQSVPPPVVVADASPERRALNEQVYDQAVHWIGRLFYRPDFGGVDWPALTAQRREAAIVQPDEASFYEALNAVIDHLDDHHTNASAPHRRQRTEALERGEAQAGYGMLMRREGEEWFVLTIQPDTPAARAGVQVGWRVESLDGRPVPASVPPVAGRAQAIVFIDDDGDRQIVEMTAEILPARPRFEAERLESGILRIRFDGFDPEPVEQVLRTLAELETAPAPGVVLDLRGNQGGSLYEMTRVMGALTAEPMIATVMTGRFIDRRIETIPASAPFVGPLAVLVDSGSVSAAEVLAAALQESGRAVIVGQRTPGVVVASRHLNLPDGGRLSIGMQELRTPAGVVLEKRGVTPDVEITPTLEQRRAGQDVALAAALERLGVSR